MNKILRLGTRGSALARWQANWVSRQLGQHDVAVELVLITTRGDTKQGPIGSLGGQGLFTREIQRALLDDRIDLAVHSLKDLPTDPIEGLLLSAVPQRETVCDVLVSFGGQQFEHLPQGARVGTGSLRRQAQLLHARPDLEVSGIRGNVDTRLKRLEEGRFDAIVLAEAGLKRLELQDRITQVLPLSLILPAIGQGALGLETRAEDSFAQDCVAYLHHPASYFAVIAERTLLASLRGGCLAPVGAYGRVEEDRLDLDAVVLDPRGETRLSTTVSGLPEDAEQIGRQAADQLLAQGAGQLIAQARGR